MYRHFVSFNIVDSKKECDDYNETTTAEVSETSSDEEISNKRNRKRKHFGSEFQTGKYMYVYEKNPL